MAVYTVMSSQDEDVSKEWLKEFGKYGFAGLVAAALLYVFINDVVASQAQFRSDHTQLREAMSSVKEIAGQSDMAQQQILYVLTTMCVNTARNDLQRSECLKRN